MTMTDRDRQDAPETIEALEAKARALRREHGLQRCDRPEAWGCGPSHPLDPEGWGRTNPLA